MRLLLLLLFFVFLVSLACFLLLDVPPNQRSAGVHYPMLWLFVVAALCGVLPPGWCAQPAATEPPRVFISQESAAPCGLPIKLSKAAPFRCSMPIILSATPATNEPRAGSLCETGGSTEGEFEQ